MFGKDSSSFKDKSLVDDKFEADRRLRFFAGSVLIGVGSFGAGDGSFSSKSFLMYNLAPRDDFGEVAFGLPGLLDLVRLLVTLFLSGEADFFTLNETEKKIRFSNFV